MTDVVTKTNVTVVSTRTEGIMVTERTKKSIVSTKTEKTMVAAGVETTVVTTNLKKTLTRVKSAPPVPVVVLTLLSVVSRKTHGTVGDFDIVLDQTQALGALVTTEPRTGTHRIVFNFDGPVTNPGSATALDSLGAAFGSVSTAALGNSVVVTIIGAPDVKRVAVALTGVNGVTNAAINAGFLIGDVNNSRSVSSADIVGVRARNGQATTSANMRYDEDLSGLIEASATGGPNADLLLVQTNSGQVI
jgi:hypothetical protein